MVLFSDTDLSDLEELIRISNDDQDVHTFRRRITSIIHRLFRSDSTIFWFMEDMKKMDAERKRVVTLLYKKNKEPRQGSL